MESCRVLLADDHAVARAGLRSMIECLAGVEVVGEAASGEEAVELCETLRPDVIFMDLRMPGLDGVEATRRITREHPGTAVVVLTAQDDDDSVYDAVRAGIAGYLSKAATLDEFEAAVEGVRAGGLYIRRDVAGRAMRSLERRVATLETSARAAALTEREREVVAMVAQGLAIRDIAQRLHMNDRTVNTHIGHAYRKLGVTNRVDAVLEAFRLGIAEPPG